DGSAAKPWASLQPALDAAPSGGLVALAAGSYAEATVVGKPVRIWGRCPAMGEIVATGGGGSLHTEGGAGAGGDAAAVPGAPPGIKVVDSIDVVLEHLWIHETAARGVGASGAGVTLHESLIEAASTAGVGAIGSDVSIQSCAVRATSPEPGTLEHGEGIAA